MTEARKLLKDDRIYEFLAVTHAPGTGIFLTGKQIKQLKDDYFTNPPSQQQCNKKFAEFEEDVFANRLLINERCRIWVFLDCAVLTSLFGEFLDYWRLPEEIETLVFSMNKRRK